MQFRKTGGGTAGLSKPQKVTATAMAFVLAVGLTPFVQPPAQAQADDGSNTFTVQANSAIISTQVSTYSPNMSPTTALNQLKTDASYFLDGDKIKEVSEANVTDYRRELAAAQEVLKLFNPSATADKKVNGHINLSPTAQTADFKTYKETIGKAQEALDAWDEAHQTQPVNQSPYADALKKLETAVDTLTAVEDPSQDSEYNKKLEAVEDALKAFNESAEAGKAINASPEGTLAKTVANYRQQYRDRKDAYEVIKLISNLGDEPTLEAIEAAEKAYDDLKTEERKALVTNHSVLTAARDKYDEAEAAADKAAADKAAADKVVDLIKAIGTVSLNSGDKITAAEKAYAALTDDQKKLVDNYATLTAARTAYDKLVADSKKTEDNKGTNTTPTNNNTTPATSGTTTTTTNTDTSAATTTETGLAKGETATTGKGATAAKVKATSDTAVEYTAPANKKAKKITVPATVKVGDKEYKVTSIAANAFKGSAATTIVVGKNVTKIGKGAFANCKKLKSVTLGKNVKTIGKNAFKGCKKLKKVTLQTSKLTKASMKNMLKGSKIKTLKLKGVSKKAKKNYKKWAKAYGVTVK